MRNDMIEARLRRLSAKAREVYEEIEKLGECASREDANREESGAQAAALLDTLTPSDRDDVLKVLDVQIADHKYQAEEVMRRTEELRRARALIQRAQDLDRAEGKSVNNAMTLKEAVERLRAAGKLSEEEERFIEQVKHRVVEVPAIQEIRHKELGRYGGETPEGHFYSHFGEHEELISRLQAHYEYALLTAAAGVYNRTGSLDIAASALGHAGFQPPPGYEAEDEDDDYYVGREALPFWIEECRDRILALADSAPAKTIAHGEMVE